MPAAVSPRAATDADVEKIAALVNAAFAVERAFVDRDRTSASEIAAMQQKGTFLVVDGSDEGLLACLYLERRGDRAYVGMLSVQPSQQGTGLGRSMMAAAETHARDWGCKALDIRILHLRVELPPFYRQLGFTETGRTGIVEDPLSREPYYFILMTKAV
jgi:GNAT superfamily N-acetyltransferase